MRLTEVLLVSVEQVVVKHYLWQQLIIPTSQNSNNNDEMKKLS
ncbi:hypothetical protein [Psychrobacter nivimaris]|nr:hypothetical protein [Psychrobacter nivimaris]